MAETVDYKVNIDASDLSNQLQNIKNQIDQAMAMYSFNTTTPLLSTSPQFPLGAQLGQATDTGAGMALGSLHNMIQAGRLGMQKLTQDMQNIALSTPVTFPAFHPSNVSWQPQFNGGMLSAGFEALTGWGYDPHMSMTRGRYDRLAGRRFEDMLATEGVTIGAGFIGSLAGGAVGALGGPIGALLGGEVGNRLAEGMAGYLDFNTANNVRTFTRDASWRFLSGEFSGGEATRIGNIAANLSRSPDLVGFRVSATDVQSSIRAFTEAGGFDFSRTADDFADKMKAVVVAIEKVKQTLQVSKEDAARIIADMQTMGVPMTADSLNNAAIGVKALGNMSGYRPQEMMEFASRAGELVRGTGIDVGSAYYGSMGMLSHVKALMANGTFSPQLMAQLGGPENAAMTMMRQGYDYMSGMGGFVDIAARTNYGPGASYFMDPYQRLIGAAAGASTVGRFMELRGAQSDIISAMGPERSYQQFAANMFTEAEAMLSIQGADMNRNSFRTAMQMTRGLSAPQADAIFNTVFQKSTNVSGRFFAQSMRELNDQAPGSIDVVTDTVGNFVGNAVNNTPMAMFGGYSIGQVAGAASGVARDFGRAVSDLGRFGRRVVYNDNAVRDTDNAEFWSLAGGKLDRTQELALSQIATRLSKDSAMASFAATYNPEILAQISATRNDPKKLQEIMSGQLYAGNARTKDMLAHIHNESEYTVSEVSAPRKLEEIGRVAAGQGVGLIAGAVFSTLFGEADKVREDRKKAMEMAGTSLQQYDADLRTFSETAQRKYGITLDASKEEEKKQLEQLRMMTSGRTDKDILSNIAAMMTQGGIKVQIVNQPKSFWDWIGKK